MLSIILNGIRTYFFQKKKFLKKVNLFGFVYSLYIWWVKYAEFKVNLYISMERCRRRGKNG